MSHLSRPRNHKESRSAVCGLCFKKQASDLSQRSRWNHLGALLSVPSLLVKASTKKFSARPVLWLYLLILIIQKSQEESYQNLTMGTFGHLLQILEPIVTSLAPALFVRLQPVI